MTPKEPLTWENLGSSSGAEENFCTKITVSGFPGNETVISGPWRFLAYKIPDVKSPDTGDLTAQTIISLMRHLPTEERHVVVRAITDGHGRLSPLGQSSRGEDFNVLIQTAEIRAHMRERGVLCQEAGIPENPQDRDLAAIVNDESIQDLYRRISAIDLSIRSIGLSANAESGLCQPQVRKKKKKSSSDSKARAAKVTRQLSGSPVAPRPKRKTGEASKREAESKKIRTT